MFESLNIILIWVVGFGGTDCVLFLCFIFCGLLFSLKLSFS